MVRTGVYVAVLALLAGCAITPENAYPEATTGQACQAAYETDVRVTAQTQSYVGSSGNLLADVLARGIGKGVAESATQNRLAACLQRVGAPISLVQAPSGGLAPLPTAQPVQTSSTDQGTYYPRCPAGGGVMVRGDGYCVGN